MDRHYDRTAGVPSQGDGLLRRAQTKSHQVSDRHAGLADGEIVMAVYAALAKRLPLRGMMDTPFPKTGLN